MEYVGVGRRAVAIIIDAIIVSIVGSIIGGIVGGVVGGASAATGADEAGFAAAVAGASSVVSIVVGILAFLYWVVLEATMGATLGKKVMGIVVVKTDGTPISWGDSLIRNILRIIDGLLVYLVAALFVWNSPLKQRLGDRVASTVVVRVGTDTSVAMA